MIKAWDDDAWDDYLHWQTQDRKTLRRINALLKDIDHNGYDGIGKPEPLRGNLSGWWSRRVDDSNRIVYRIREGRIEIIQCGSHYRDSRCSPRSDYRAKAAPGRYRVISPRHFDDAFPAEQRDALPHFFRCFPLRLGVLKNGPWRPTSARCNPELAKLNYWLCVSP